MTRNRFSAGGVGLCVGLLVVTSGCIPRRKATAPVPPPVVTQPPPPPPPPVPVRAPELEQRVARLELRVIERDGQIAELQTRLDEARREVVRAMAKLQTLATRAEAASAIAEGEIALQALRNSGGTEAATDIAQAQQLLDMSSGEFNRGNFGGALYLANQSKNLAGTRRGRLGAERSALRPGETPYALPLNLQAIGQSNVREGPGRNFSVVFTVEKGALLTGHSYAGEWMRISDEAGRTGWVYLTLVGRRGG